MTRRLKTREPLSTTLEKEVYKQLKEHTGKTKVPISKFLDDAVVDRIKKEKDALK